MAICKACLFFSPLASGNDGLCLHPSAAVEFPAKKRKSPKDSCEDFQPKRPARRRTVAATAPSADARHIAEAIAAGFERLAGVLEYSLTAMHEDDDNVFKAASRGADRLHDMNEHLERLVEHLIDD